VALKLKLEEIETQVDPKGLESAFQTAKQKQVGAIMMPVLPYFGERKRIVELAVKYRLPAIYFLKEFVDEGGLMSYGTDYTDLYRLSARGYLCGQDPKRCEARRSPGGAAEEIRVHHQSESG
jgi:putative ABC transport system substrate-binding protein